MTITASAADALRALLAREPRVIAFGEYHQTTKTAAVTSAVKRFTDELLPLLGPGASDIVVETWLTQGRCGEAEKAVVKDVEKTTERPATTENEVVTLIRRAKALGTQPHILEVSCQEYETLRQPDGQVDYEKMLKLTSDKLEGRINAALDRKSTDPPRAVAVYGGALHNDLHPIPEFAPFTFGRSVHERVGGRYLEVDLYVPEYIEKDPRMRSQPWFAAYKSRARSGRAALIERAAGSFIIVFPRTARRR